ncbi:MAG: hypothetical protein JNM27_11340 [Leptospirales bacterium]|nr:hypothetical protein [Leptospirales bacterium]
MASLYAVTLNSWMEITFAGVLHGIEFRYAMFLKIAGHRGRCIIVRDPLRFVYRLASRHDHTTVAARDVAEHWNIEHPGKHIHGAAIVRSDFQRLHYYGDLLPEEKVMEEAIGDNEFLIVLDKPDSNLFLHEAAHILHQLQAEFRQYAIEAILRAPDYSTLSFAIISRAYSPHVVIEEILAHLVADFYGQPWLTMTGNDGLAEDLRSRLLSEIRLPEVCRGR